MARVERSSIIDAPVDMVFNYITNPENDLQWIPSMLEVWDVTRTEERVGTH